MSKAKNGNGHAGSGVFGSPERVLVKRGLAEFRSGRPVVFSSQDGKFLIALPVDGLDAARLHAFEHLCAPAKPRAGRDGAARARARHRVERTRRARRCRKSAAPKRSSRWSRTRIPTKSQNSTARRTSAPTRRSSLPRSRSVCPRCWSPKSNRRDERDDRAAARHRRSRRGDEIPAATICTRSRSRAKPRCRCRAASRRASSCSAMRSAAARSRSSSASRIFRSRCRCGCIRRA